jgi:beta-fructofuranosidase
MRWIVQNHISFLLLLAFSGIAPHAQAAGAPTRADSAIARAMESVKAAIPRAEADPARPVFHFRPPALWMNDPNGTIFYKGWYHVFYQHNPYGDNWGHMHWGHARSRDLVHWEHLAIALWPSEEEGEEHCFSGCAAINRKGRPMLFYTSVAPGRKRPNEQWAALGNDDMMVWEKHPANPILSLKTPGAPRVEGDWRDPFIFREAGRTFLVLGAKEVGGEGVVVIYEAEDADLARWVYRGVLFRAPNKEFRFVECPNFFKLGKKWVLLCSPFTPVQYFVGSLDLKTYTFTPENRGKVDHSGSFYASNVLFDNKGRCVLLGWVRGFPAGKGWNGCLALPRLASISADGQLLQEPVPELKSLRDQTVKVSTLALNDDARMIEGIKDSTLEIQAELRRGDSVQCGIRLRRSPSEKEGLTIAYDGKSLNVVGVSIPLSRHLEADEPLKLRVFLDKSVLEVFAGGHTCCTRVVPTNGEEVQVQVFAKGGQATVKNLQIWRIKPVW